MASSIHIRLESSEALHLKKETLFLEKGMLELISHMRAYNFLRKKEFTIKSQIKKDLVSLNNLILSLESHLPEEDLKEIKEKSAKQEQKSFKKEKSRVKIKEIKVEKNSDIEKEIAEIREKLARLG